MVKLDKIYTRGGDAGETSLGDGARRPKHDLRIEAMGEIDEANAAIGLARVALQAQTPADAALDAMLERIQNDLFDLGADLCMPEGDADFEAQALRIAPSQAARLESEIDEMNQALSALRSFILPGGSEGAARLHLARTICRRAERKVFELAGRDGETVSAGVRQFINRLSDFLFVAARRANENGARDVLWTPGANR